MKNEHIKPDSICVQCLNVHMLFFYRQCHVFFDLSFSTVLRNLKIPVRHPLSVKNMARWKKIALYR